MKTYKNLYAKLISEDNIRDAIHSASRSKADRPMVKKINANVEWYIPNFQRMCDNYKNYRHSPKEIYDGISRKKRTILVPAHKEQVVHHMVVNVLKPIFMKSMYEHSYGSIPGRGAHLAMKRIKRWLYKYPERTRYCLKTDIKKYFDSIPHTILKAKLQRIIKDENFLRVLFEIIDVQNKGIPLGFYTSQWLANFYLTSLDHYIKEQLGADFYVRYVDDMVILGSDKQRLHEIRVLIQEYLENELGLTMKPNWQIFEISDFNGKESGRALDFLGFKFYRYKTVLRRSIMLRASRKARKLNRKAKISIFECRQFLSYVGWLSTTNVYEFYLHWIKPFVDIGYMKQRISNFDRRQLLCGVM